MATKKTSRKTTKKPKLASEKSPSKKRRTSKKAPSKKRPGSKKRAVATSSRKSEVRRVCILTGGGDAPALNAVLRAFVKTCDEEGIQVFGSEDGFEGLIHPGRLVKLTRESVRGILPKGGSILGCSNRANPFAYPSKDKRGRPVYEDVSDAVIDRLERHDIDVLAMVGGDGTMSHAVEMMKRGVQVVGVPKTIDNDLAATDVTFGFDTAVSTATWAIDALHSTAESHDRVMVVELMGRYAGWISLHAGIAGGADAIVIPEMPYDINRIVDKIEARARRGSTFSIVVVGEGAMPKGGRRATISAGRKGHLERLGGAGQAMADLLKDRVPHEVRVTVLGHLQRGGSPSTFDRLLGTRYGVAAAKLCQAGKTGMMVALRGQNIVAVPIKEAVDNGKLVRPDGELVEVARLMGIEMGQ